MALILSRQIYQTLQAFAEMNYPHECCAILGGTLNGENRHCTDVYLAVNQREDAAKARRFEISPVELLKAEKQFRHQKLDTLGFFHTHPDHPATPSQFDLDHASWPNYSYPIWAIDKGKAGALNSYVLSSDRTHFVPESLTLQGE